MRYRPIAAKEYFLCEATRPVADNAQMFLVGDGSLCPTAAAAVPFGEAGTATGVMTDVVSDETGKTLFIYCHDAVIADRAVYKSGILFFFGR